MWYYWRSNRDSSKTDVLQGTRPRAEDARYAASSWLLAARLEQASGGAPAQHGHALSGAHAPRTARAAAARGHHGDEPQARFCAHRRRRELEKEQTGVGVGWRPSCTRRCAARPEGAIMNALNEWIHRLFDLCGRGVVTRSSSRNCSFISTSPPKRRDDEVSPRRRRSARRASSSGTSPGP